MNICTIYVEVQVIFMTIDNLLKRELDFFSELNQTVYNNLVDKYHFVSGVPYSVLPIEKKGRLVGNILYRMYRFKDENDDIFFVANTDILDEDVWKYTFCYCDKENQLKAQMLITEGREKLKTSEFTMELYEKQFHILDNIYCEGEGFFENSRLLVIPKYTMKALVNTGFIRARL